MKKLKKLSAVIKKWAKTDVIGTYKNILLVGERNPLSEDLIKTLDPSFNIFSIYNSEKYEEGFDMLHQSDVSNFKDNE